MPFPAFSAGHFEQINTKENAIGPSRGQGRTHFFVSHSTITFLPVRLWNNKRIKEILQQRHQYNARKLSVIPIS